MSPSQQPPFSTATLNRLAPTEIDALRAPGERAMFWALMTFSTLVISTFVVVAISTDPSLLLNVGTLALASWIGAYFSWRATYWFVHGNSVRVSATQYPSIHYAVEQAAEALRLKVTPSIFLLQGHGLVEMFIAKQFSRRGMIILTSNLADDLSGGGDTKRLMMVVGRQLGHIASGHFQYGFLIDVIGSLLPFLRSAYKRRCHYTADRIGLLICGDYVEASNALLTFVAGKTFAPITNPAALKEQTDELSENLFAQLIGIFRAEPYMICRLNELRLFDNELRTKRIKAANGNTIQILNVQHFHLTGVSIANQVIGNYATFGAPPNAPAPVPTTPPAPVASAPSVAAAPSSPGSKSPAGITWEPLKPQGRRP